MFTADARNADPDFSPEFIAVVIVIEDEAISRHDIRDRAASVLGYPPTARNVRRHLMRAVETGCCVKAPVETLFELPGKPVTGYKLPCDTLSCDQAVRAALLKNGIEPLLGGLGSQGVEDEAGNIHSPGEHTG